jgi:hypothetical protein
MMEVMKYFQYILLQFAACLSSIQLKNLNWIRSNLNLNLIKHKFNIFIWMEFNFYKINSIVSSFLCHWYFAIGLLLGC